MFNCVYTLCFNRYISLRICCIRKLIEDYCKYITILISLDLCGQLKVPYLYIHV